MFPFPTDPQLTGIVIAYKNGAYIADQVLPRVAPRLTKREFKYLKFAFAESITLPDAKVGRKSAPNQVEFSATEVADFVEDFGLDDVVPFEDVQNAPEGYDPLGHAAQRLMDLVLLGREKRVADKVFAASTYPAANRTVLSGTSQWSHASSNPLVAVQDAADGMVMRPNIMVIGRPAWTQLRRNPSIIQAVSVSGTDKGAATQRAVADLFELDEIIVGEAWINTARKGQAVSTVRLWGKHAALLHRAPLATSQSDVPTFGWTAQYLDKIAGKTPEPNIGLRGSTRCRAGESVREVIAANDLGFFFENAAA